MTYFRGLIGALVLTGLIAPTVVADDKEETSSESSAVVYELRTYTTHPGRLDALHARFKNHTKQLFKKHGMENVMYWTPVDKEETLVYLLRHQSLEAAAKSWRAFANDPAWKTARAESEKDGPIVKKVERQYLTTTEYSPNALPSGPAE